jgi:hypothetical protein
MGVHHVGRQRRCGARQVSWWCPSRGRDHPVLWWLALLWPPVWAAVARATHRLVVWIRDMIAAVVLGAAALVTVWLVLSTWD